MKDNGRALIDSTQFTLFLSLFSDSMDDYLYMWDIQDDCFYISSYLLEKCALPGSRIHNIIPLWASLLHRRDRERFTASIESILAGETDCHNLDYRLQNRSGQYEWFNCRGKALRDANGSAAYLFGVLAQVNDRYIDPVTGFYRALRLKPDFDACEAQAGSLIVFGVDKFKDINEKYGWHWGNRTLTAAAAAIDAGLPEGASAYRLDGDKFGVLLPDGGATQAQELFSQASRRLAGAANPGGKPLFCTMSAGCAEFPADSSEYEALYQFAESALHQAKRDGRNRLATFRRDSYNDHVQQISLREALLRSVNNAFDGFSLTYQPQVSGIDGHIKGAEALLRWRSPLFGPRSPVEFIPPLEESGLIVDVGRWVIEQALDQCAVWRRTVPDFCMSVNLSYVQLEQDDVPAFLLEALRARGLPANAVALEITESGQLRDYQYFNGLFSGLAHEDVEIAIDDFGTGYSSLAYLKHLNVDVVKVDKCFVDRILSSEYDYRFLRNLIELAHSVALEVCLEGVESQEEVQAVLPLGPDIFQGYFFGKPCPAEEFAEKYLNASFLRAVAGSCPRGRSGSPEADMAQELRRLREENRRLSKSLRLTADGKGGTP